MKDDMLKQKCYWDKEAYQFDLIYSCEKNIVKRILDSVFRYDMYKRFEYTMASAEPIEGRSFLDIGCGSGRYSLELARRNAGRVVGLDISETMLKMCEERARKEKLMDRSSFVQADIMQYHPEAKFDVCIAMGLFDYISQPLSALTKIRESTTDKVIMSFPKLWTWRAPLRKIRLYLRHCDVYFYTLKDIDILLKSAGFKHYKAQKIGQLYCVTASVT